MTVRSMVVGVTGVAILTAGIVVRGQTQAQVAPNKIPLQSLLDQGFEVKAAVQVDGGASYLYLQKGAALYTCMETRVECDRLGLRR